MTVAAPYLVYDGYGSVAEYLALGMARSGADVRVLPFRIDKTGMSQEFLELLGRARPEPDAPALCFCWPLENFAPVRLASELFLYTMWETSQLPRGWAQRINQADVVMVPSRFNVRMFRASGVTRPIEVVSQGIDPRVYHYLDRADRPGVTTLTVGTFLPRKNIDIGIAAWKQAFAGDPEARLIIKSRFGHRRYEPDDPRIEFIDSEETTRGIAHWYKKADVLLALGNEGFGLPLVEGMATGLPVVALDADGQADVCRDARQYVLPVKPVDHVAFDVSQFGPCGTRPIPGVDDVAKQLRWVADHRDEARAMGRMASRWAIKHRDIWTVGPRALEVMEQYRDSPRPLRRFDTLWLIHNPYDDAPEADAQDLAQALPSVKVVASDPDLGPVHRLHVQHHGGDKQDDAVAQCMRKCRDAGVPVAVTVHDVSPETRAWEGDADVLVAVTDHDAGVLRERWPAKRVEVLPPGCPTWFVRSKPKRGRVIATVATLANGSAAWQVLEVLGAMPGVELLLFTRPGDPKTERVWARASAGLKIRRVVEPLTEQSICQQLAAQADVLALSSVGDSVTAARRWARLGLCAGVATVTLDDDPAYRDLAAVTHQASDLLAGVTTLLNQAALRKTLVEAGRQYCQEHSWRRTAGRHLALWQTLNHC